MNNRLFIGQLSYSVDSESLKDFFMSIGEVVSARVMTHKDSGRSKGFGFVEMSTEEAANKAIELLHGKELMGRAIVVAVAKPPEKRPSGTHRFADGGRGGGRDTRGGGRGSYSDRGPRDGGRRRFANNDQDNGNHR